jgi:uncharacterized Zn-binding protein involved in type VI secretion
MPAAARLGDKTTHGGVVMSPSPPPKVLIAGQPAARAGDIHLCPVPQPHPPSVFAKGSATVLIGGRPALRAGDVAGCGAALVGGATTVQIGG